METGHEDRLSTPLAIFGAMTMRRQRLHLGTEVQPYSENSADRLLSPKELADRLGVTADWVYRHQAELCPYRLGCGPKAPLRFDLDKVLTCLAGREAVPAPAPVAKPRKRQSGSWHTGRNVELLPLRPRKPRSESAEEGVEPPRPFPPNGNHAA